MGFTYDFYTTIEEVEYATEVHKTQLLLKALVLDDKQAEKYSDILQKYTYDFSNMNTESYKELCMQKRSESCYYFKEDTDGFDAKIKLDDPKLVFFSVPYEKGWTAEINGEPAEIEKVSYGFMAEKCPSGDNTITFRYKTAGLAEGRIITFVGAGILAAYIAVGYALRKKAAAKSPEAEAANEENNSQDN